MTLLVVTHEGFCHHFVFHPRAKTAKVQYLQTDAQVLWVECYQQPKKSHHVLWKLNSMTTLTCIPYATKLHMLLRVHDTTQCTLFSLLNKLAQVQGDHLSHPFPYNPITSAFHPKKEKVCQRERESKMKRFSFLCLSVINHLKTLFLNLQHLSGSKQF